MAYCTNCGKQISDQAVVCPHCGVPARKTSNVNDDGGILWGLLGFCVPVAGLILYLIWKDEQPNNAKAAGLGALISVGVGIVTYILIIVIALAGASGF